MVGACSQIFSGVKAAA